MSDSEPARPPYTTLASAVRGGYYDIPRRMSTQDLADEFGISDQAVTERFRRSIASLVAHTLLPADAADSASRSPDRWWDDDEKPSYRLGA
nr:helix-turn-helix domain-containing protein [Salinigranum halophilum]